MLSAAPIQPVIPDAAHPLPLSAVRLTGGPLKRAQDLDAQYLLKLEPDRMLAFFRKRAGLEPKAQPYGGWDGDGKNLTGHIAGHYLSAVSLMWAATGDARFYAAAGASSGHDADDRLVYDTSSGHLYYDADGSGAGAAQLVANLPAGSTLVASDIWVI